MQISANTKAKPAFIVLALLAVIGAGAWIYQLVGGLGVTGMSNATSWGLYITFFMLFVGLSAGGLIVASSASVFKIEKYKAVAMPAVICSTVCICIAAAFVLIDLGGIQRAWRLLTGPNFSSPLVWDMLVIAIYLAINILDLVWMAKGEDDKVEKLSRLALPVAVLVHSVTAWIFGLEVGREGWNSALMAPIFVASALDSGMGLLILSLLGLDKAGLFRVEEKLVSSLAGLLAVFIAVDAFFIGCELLTMAYSGGDDALAVLGHMLAGPTAPFFWLQILGGLLAPFLILVFAKNRGKVKLVAVASALVILGVLCKRVWLLLSSFITPLVAGGPGISLGTKAAQVGYASDVWAVAGSYFPTLVEFAIVIGVIALGGLAYMVISQKMLVVPPAEPPSEDAA